MTCHRWLIGEVDGLGDNEPVFCVSRALFTNLLLDATEPMLLCGRIILLVSGLI